MRRDNSSRLLRYVHEHGPTPRSRLTAVLALNRSTIGDLTRELADAGLVREDSGRASGSLPGTVGAGRPSYVVSPESAAIQVLAVDVGVTHLTVARVGLGGVVVERWHRSYRRGTRHSAQVVRAIRAAVDDMSEGHAAAVFGMGVAVPGMVRHADGQVRDAPNLGWRDVPLGDQLTETLGLPVSVANDADLGMRAEHVRGAARGVDDAVYLSGHSGVGAGIIAGGMPLGGRAGYAGEVGHATVNTGGLPCHCGSVGCWETECGEERLLALAGRTARSGLRGVREVVTAAREGDSAAQHAVDHVATWLGRGTANVVNVLNPEVVIMGGAFEEILVAARERVATEFANAGLRALVQDVELVRPSLGADSTLIGAAELAFDPLVTDPLGYVTSRAVS